MIVLLRAIAGLVVWGLAFSSFYALQGHLCANQTVGSGPSRLMLFSLYVSWLALHLWLCWHLWPLRRGPALVDQLAVGMAVVGLISTAYTGFPVTLTTGCA